MNMLQSETTSLWGRISGAGYLSDRFLSGAVATVTLGSLIDGSCLGGRAGELRGKSVLIWTRDQLTAALALIELDGVARRMVLCPSDLPVEHLPFLIDLAGVDAVVSDRTTPGSEIPEVGLFVTCSPKIVPADCPSAEGFRTEWILLTSGTTGLPKLVVHTLSSLAGAIESPGESPNPFVWSTFYDIRRYGGMRIFLRALLTGASMVLSSTEGTMADFLARAAAYRITHISGTPSHWRRALMSQSAHKIAPQYIRLSGEIADQAILDHLHSFYPEASIAHAFASTEAGVAFDVNDGHAGFPVDLIGNRNGVEMKVEDGPNISSPGQISSKIFEEFAAQFDLDFLFLDGRTGTGPLFPVYVYSIPHLLVLFVGLNDQNVTGSLSILNAKTSKPTSAAPVFLVVSPVPTVDRLIGATPHRYCQRVGQDPAVKRTRR